MNRSAEQHEQPIPRPKPRWRAWFTGWNAIGVLLLLGSLLASLWQVGRAESRHGGSDVGVVRIAHWQLELGYRDALQGVINDYNAIQQKRYDSGEIPRRIVVEQVPVSEKIYGQLINTHLIAGTAPEIIEMGKASMISGAYRAQYFLNLSSIIQEPNPYNRREYQADDLAPGLSGRLESLSWRETFIDGLAGGFDADLQGYFSIPTTFAPWNRYAVNLDMLQEATGSDKMPRTLGAFLNACDRMRELGLRQGRDLWPIAGSSYSVGFYNNYAVPFMAKAQSRLDADHDGTVTIFESLTGLKLGAWSFEGPEFGSFVDAISAVARNFPSGFLGMDREGAMLMFTQQKSGFFYCGAWDVGTVNRLAAGRFRVGIIENVMPGPGEAWGPLAGINEASMTASCAFGINKTGSNVDAAIDFLRFWTSHAQNQRFNREADWVPCIVGSRLPPHMAAYAPQIEGYANGSAWLFPWGQGEHLSTIFDGKLQSVLAGRSARSDVVESMKRAIDDPNYGIDAVLRKKLDDARSAERNAERGIAIQAFARLADPDRATSERNYVVMVSAQAAQLNGLSAEISMRCLKGAIK